MSVCMFVCTAAIDKTKAKKDCQSISKETQKERKNETERQREREEKDLERIDRKGRRQQQRFH